MLRGLHKDSHDATSRRTGRSYPDVYFGRPSGARIDEGQRTSGCSAASGRRDEHLRPPHPTIEVESALVAPPRCRRSSRRRTRRRDDRPGIVAFGHSRAAPEGSSPSSKILRNHVAIKIGCDRQSANIVSPPELQNPQRARS